MCYTFRYQYLQRIHILRVDFYPYPNLTCNPKAAQGGRSQCNDHAQCQIALNLFSQRMIQQRDCFCLQFQPALLQARTFLLKSVEVVQDPLYLISYYDIGQQNLLRTCWYSQKGVW